MEITTDRNGGELTVTVEGRLDTVTAPQLESRVNASLDGVTKLIFELEKLDYISSAGLRTLLSAQKLMNKKGEMVLRRVKPEVMEVFEITGFVDIMSFENE